MREDKTSVETKAESVASLDVPTGRSNFARKNAPCQDSICYNMKIYIFTFVALTLRCLDKSKIFTNFASNLNLLR